MRSINKTLRLAGILALCINVLNIGSLLLNINTSENLIYDIIINSIGIALTFVTGIVYLCLHKKDEDYLAKHKGLFVTLLWLNIFNNIFVWIISLWVEIMVSGLHNRLIFTQYKENSENPNDVVLDNNSYNVKKEAEDLSEGLKELDSLKEKGSISEDEYNELRQSLINKFLNKQN